MFSHGVKQALIKSLEIDPSDRIGSIDELREYLTGVYEPSSDAPDQSALSSIPPPAAIPALPEPLPETSQPEVPPTIEEDRFTRQDTIFDAPSAYKPSEKMDEPAEVYTVEPENPVSGDGTGYDFNDSVEFVEEESATRDLPLMDPEQPNDELDIDFLEGFDPIEPELIPPTSIPEEDEVPKEEEFEYSEGRYGSLRLFAFCPTAS